MDGFQDEPVGFYQLNSSQLRLKGFLPLFMIWLQKQLNLAPRPRGFHLVTAELVSCLPDLQTIETGLAHFFLQHTSASLSLNENADPTVRSDMESHFLRSVPDDPSLYRHTCEGPDDMPAHIKSALLGAELTIPVRAGQLCLGTWQGIYLGEHREYGGSRRVIVTLTGIGSV